MKKVRVRSMEDFEALPEGEWVEVVGPMWWDVDSKSPRLEGGELIFRLPTRVRRAFKARQGEILDARVTGEALVVSRRPRKKSRKAG